MTAKITPADRTAAHANIAAHGEEDCDYWRGRWAGRLPRPDHRPMCDRLAQAIADAREAATIVERVACVEWVRDAEGDGVANDLVAARMVR